MASIFDIFRRKKVEAVPVQEERSIFGDFGLGFNNISSYSQAQSMRLSAVYAATNMISNTVALLPIKVVKYEGEKKSEITHPLYQILNLTPSAKYNKFNFMKLLIESLILNGNGYAYIERDEKLNVKSLQLIDPAYVTPMPQNDGTVKYVVSGMKSAVDSANMIHLYMHVDDMFNGISVIKYADMALRGAFDAEKHSDQFFKSGAGLMGVLKASAPLTDAQKTQIAQSWEKSITKTAGGGVAILPQGLDFQSIAVSPEDSQLLETRQYNIVEIARFFNVSPVKLFDYSHVSYSTLEQTALSYLQDTILPYTQLLEDELNRKLFKPSEVGKLGVDFDYTEIIQTNKKDEADYYRQLLVNGILSINEVRSKMGYTPVEEDYADKHWIQISYAAADAIAEGAYIRPQDQGQNQKVDNKVKSDEE